MNACTPPPPLLLPTPQVISIVDWRTEQACYLDSACPCGPGPGPSQGVSDHLTPRALPERVLHTRHALWSENAQAP